MKIIIVTILIVVATAVSALHFYKPTRIFFPYAGGVKCPLDNICVDDITRLEEAKDLSSAANNFITKTLGMLSYKPDFIFCSTQKCFEAFGAKKSKADTYGTIVSVIGPDAWKDYIIRHELIHQWQADKIGFFRRTKIPRWLSEGMAYELSEDPRNPLKEPWETYRNKFRLWIKDIDKDKLLDEINKEI